MLRATYDGPYKSPSKTTGLLEDRFRYKVSGTPEELEQYEAAQGTFFRADKETGEALFFSRNYLGRSVELGFSQKTKRVFANTSHTDTIRNLIKQNEDSLMGVELAKLGAQELWASIRGGSSGAASVTPPVPGTPEPAAAEGNDLDD